MYWRGGSYGNISVSRRKLYEQMWSTPCSRLAIQYGISDVGLAKVCKRYNIPRPPRGYWAKREAGQKVKRTPLPRLPGVSGDVLVYMQGFDMPEDAVKSAMAAAKDAEVQQAKVPADDAPDPLVLVAGEQLRTAKPDHDGLVATDPATAVEIRVSQPLIDRSLSVLDGFVKRWSAHGGVTRIGVPDRHGRPSTAVQFEGDHLYVRFEEAINESKPITDPARRSGYLALYIDGEENRQFRRRWSDTKTQRIDKMYKPLIETLLLTMNLMKAERLDEECEARQKKLVEARRKASARSHDREFYWRQDLMEAVTRWHDAERVRDYLRALKTAVDSQAIRFQDEALFSQWFEWATRYADAIDPTIRAKLPDDVAGQPRNTSAADLDVTSFTRPVIVKLGVKDTDELWRLTDEQVRAACEGRAGKVWDEITRILEGLGYDVTKRKPGTYWW